MHRLQAIEHAQSPINRHPETGRPLWFCNVHNHARLVPLHNMFMVLAVLCIPRSSLLLILNTSQWQPVFYLLLMLLEAGCFQSFRLFALRMPL